MGNEESIQDISSNIRGFGNCLLNMEEGLPQKLFSVQLTPNSILDELNTYIFNFLKTT